MNNGMNDATKIFELYLESKEEPIMTTTSDGAKMWYLHGKRHREDGPAIEWANGTKSWFINGKLHREDGPATEYADGQKRWYLHNKRHREDGPAIEYADGTKSWFINGKHCADISAWAEAVLHHQNKPATQDDVDEMIAQVMQQDLFN